jgi:hypothetical protein
MATDKLREIAEQLAEPCVFWCGEQDYTKDGYADSIVEAFTKALERAMLLAIQESMRVAQISARDQPLFIKAVVSLLAEFLKAEAKK